jgi:hypothetical protein
MFLSGEYTEEELQMRRACRHDVKHARYLSCLDTPHVQNPDTLCVRVSVFLCENCGLTFPTYTELPRGFLADGTLTQKMEDEIRNRQLEKMATAKALEMAKTKDVQNTQAQGA